MSITQRDWKNYLILNRQADEGMFRTGLYGIITRGMSQSATEFCDGKERTAPIPDRSPGLQTATDGRTEDGKGNESVGSTDASDVDTASFPALRGYYRGINNIRADRITLVLM